MRLRWTEEAASDLERIADYLFLHSPDLAAKILRSIFDAPAALLTFPHRGRPGKKEGTREMVLPGSPYIVIYAVRGEVINIARILHGAQQWPLGSIG